MQLRRMLLWGFASISVVSLGFSGCTNRGDFQAEAQAPANTTQSPPKKTQADVPFVPTPQTVVNRMLELAQAGKNDVVYDLGSGDGRIPITAVQKFGVRRAVGIDINRDLVLQSRANAQNAKVSSRVEFRQQDLFQTDLRNATVVTLYLLPDVNIKLRPKLLRELKPGTRIVSHAFDMGEWKPQRTEEVDGRMVYLWVVPKNPPANLK
jgi:SAM-dependent methyltransferase